MYFSAGLVLCQESREHGESSGRQEPHSWPGTCTHGQVHLTLSFLQRKINFNVTLANAKYLKYSIGNAKRLPIKWKTVLLL